jgi:hypothetical protein
MGKGGLSGSVEEDKMTPAGRCAVTRHTPGGALRYVPSLYLFHFTGVQWLRVCSSDFDLDNKQFSDDDMLTKQSRATSDCWRSLKKAKRALAMARVRMVLRIAKISLCRSGMGRSSVLDM